MHAGMHGQIDDRPKTERLWHLISTKSI